jgi:NAD(P)-dependent dehydrogenase (short-subunit alcohol dehydrogenase family)
MTNLFDLTGRTTAVTGSARGIGRAMVIALAGADLVLLDRSEVGITRRITVRLSPSWRCW